MKSYLLVLCCFLSFLSYAQKKQIRLNLEVGKEYSQTTVTKVSIGQILFGRKSNSTVTIIGKTVYHVKDVADSLYNMNVCYNELGMQMQNGMNTTEFSSEHKDAEGLFSTVLSQIKNKWFSIKMNSRGEITSVEGIATLFEKIDELNADTAIVQKLKSQMVDAFGEKALKRNMEFMSAVYPQHEVERGDTWTIQQKVQSATPINVTTIYTLKHSNNDFYTITSKSRIASADKSLFVATGEVQSKYDLKGTMSNEIKIDKHTGWIIESKMKQEIKGKAFVKLNKDMEDGVIVPMIIRTETLISNK